MMFGEAKTSRWTAGGPEVRFGPDPPSMFRPWGDCNLMKTKGLSQCRDLGNERLSGTPLPVSEVELDTAAARLYIHGRRLVAL